MPAMFVAAVLAVATLVAMPAAEADVLELPAPSFGCLDSVAGAWGLFENTVDPAAGVTLNVPGQVEQVIIEWMGEWGVDPVDAEMDLSVEGPGGTETGTTDSTLGSKDSINLDGTSPPFTFGYWADITDLFGDGAAGSYTVDITDPPPDPSGGIQNYWWGAAITVVYDTTPCGQIAEIIWKIGSDYYFGGNNFSPPTTDLIVYDFAEPLPQDLLATVRASHGGADSNAGTCRVSIMWVGTGTDEVAPTVDDSLVDFDGNPVYPGAVEGVIDPFTPPNQPCPAPVINDPVQALRGGYVGDEYALIEMDILIPAGSTWMAFQLESPRDNNGETGQPESGAWGGGGILVIPAVGQEPAVSLEKTVLDGAGGACPGVEGTDELVSTAVGAAVTYCFRVQNTGNTSLFPVVIDDPDLGITQDDMTLVSGDDTVPLQIGAELVYSYEAEATEDLVNVATVTGTPTDADGDPIDGLDDVTDTNDAEVDVQAPAVALEKTVLEGPGATCPGVEGDDELVQGANGDPVTYCFKVTNIGEFALFPVTLDDLDLGITDADMTLVSGNDSVPLASGGVLVYSAEATIEGDLVNTAEVTGTPVGPEGEPLDLDDVTDTNDAEVVELVGDPVIALEKTVLDGAGAVCPGVEGTDELVTGANGAPVTYCFRVENTGETHLFPVSLDDPDLGITDADMTLVSGDDTVPLAPGGVLVYSAEATIDGNLVNVAEVTGTPSDPQGEPLPEAQDVTDTNDAEVVETAADIAIEKTVLEGPDGACPGVNGTDELVAGEAGTAVTYCFRVENTGGTFLFPVVVDDPDLGITQADMTLVEGDDTVPLPPGGVLVYSYESTIVEDLVNVATVTGDPVDEDGEPTGDDPVTDDDDAEVQELVLLVEFGPACDNDTPYLDYSIVADGLGTEATITFADGDDSESYVVPVGSGRLLWPGAVIDDQGNPIDWPGWDQDVNGDWYLNPDNPYQWARGDVEVTVEVNPTFGPESVDYPPAEPTCSAVPPEETTPPPFPELPRTGLDVAWLLVTAIAAAGLGGLLLGRVRSATRQR